MFLPYPRAARSALLAALCVASIAASPAEHTAVLDEANRVVVAVLVRAAGLQP